MFIIVFYRIFIRLHLSRNRYLLKWLPRQKSHRLDCSPGDKKQKTMTASLFPWHTADHLNCPACLAADAQLRIDPLDLASLPFSAARKRWEKYRREDASLRESTHESTATHLNAIEKFFGLIPLSRITPGHLRCYQEARQRNLLAIDGEEKHPWIGIVKNATINKEITQLSLLLGHCKLWAALAPYYFPLETPTWSPVKEIMEEGEERRFFHLAMQEPRARLAYLVALVTNNTSASGCELRGLRIGSISLRRPELISEIYIPEDAVKNHARPRVIALNETARWAIEQLLRRAKKLGCKNADDFLFPFRSKRNKYDPGKRAGKTFLRKSWEQLRIATGRPELCPHHFRHHCITRLLEAGTNEHVAKSLVGHIPTKTLEYYAHPRRQAKYAAVIAIDSAEALRPTKKPPQRVQYRDSGTALVM